MKSNCRVCGCDDMKLLIDLGIQPVAHNLLNSQDEEDKIKHPLKLHYCQHCGFVQINDPISPDELYTDDVFMFSQWKNQPQIPHEIDWIKQSLPDTNSKIVEVGCNDGIFIKALLQAGYHNVIGIESNVYTAKEAEKTGAKIINSMFLTDTVQKIVEDVGKADLLILRQVLEHIPDLDGFFNAASYILNDDGMLFIEVPDFGVSLKNANATTIWEEHPNYFTQQTLDFLFRKYNFEPLSWNYYDFSGGAIAVLSKKNINASKDLGKYVITGGVLEEYINFADRVFGERNKIYDLFTSAHKTGFEICLYGSGNRACLVANGLSLGKCFDKCVDDQTEKQGHFIPSCQLYIDKLDNVIDRSKKQMFLLAVNHENDKKVTDKILRQNPDAFVTSILENNCAEEINKYMLQK